MAYFDLASRELFEALCLRPNRSGARVVAVKNTSVGNGAVFKLVPEYFPKAVGSVTGLVGASGGLGGFFPPLALGLIKELTGSFVWGFILLAVFALGCFAVILSVKATAQASARA